MIWESIKIDHILLV